jgi:hypothetical protein
VTPIDWIYLDEDELPASVTRGNLLAALRKSFVIYTESLTNRLIAESEIDRLRDILKAIAVDTSDKGLANYIRNKLEESAQDVPRRTLGGSNE